jgi:hypothetical protein
MNTGIGDAINLGWKLAMVIQGRAPAALLDSYEPERIAFARKLVATTDRAFTAVVASGLTGTIVRRALMPLLFRLGTSVAIARRTMFRLVSQIEIEYQDSQLSEGKAGHVAAGDRLPWVADVDNFAPLASLDWQAHVYGEPSNDVRRVCDALDIPLHAFPWTEGARHAGLGRDALYLVRPDGYVGFAAEGHHDAGLSAYWSRHQLRMTRPR